MSRYTPEALRMAARTPGLPLLIARMLTETADDLDRIKGQCAGLLVAAKHVQDLAKDGRWDLLADYVEGGFEDTGFTTAIAKAEGEK